MAARVCVTVRKLNWEGPIQILVFLTYTAFVLVKRASQKSRFVDEVGSVLQSHDHMCKTTL